MIKSIKRAYKYRFYPSSKTCSACGHIYKDLTLFERQWTCVSCNAQHDRDENACLNLYHYYDSVNNNSDKVNNVSKINTKNSKSNCKTAVGTTVVACGRNVRPVVLKKVTSKKQLAISCETGIPNL